MCSSVVFVCSSFCVWLVVVVVFVCSLSLRVVFLVEVVREVSSFLVESSKFFSESE